MIDPFENLSPGGLARREAILRQTLLALRRRRRRRRALRLGTGLAVVALAAILIRVPRYPGNASPGAAGPVSPLVAAGPVVQVIPPDPGICVRLAAPALPATWGTIDDEQLLAALNEAGQQAGLVRVAGQTLLMRQ